MDRAKMLELFGSDSEDDGDDDEPVVPSAVRAEAEEAEGAENVDEGDLFGSDGEEGEEGQPSSSLPQVPSAAPLEYELPVLRRPPDDAELFLVRMPNILKIQPRPFEADNPESIQDELVQPELDGKKASGGDGEALYEMRSENVIRWRQNSETGSRQSNAKLVRWSDGSMTLHVGSEVLVAPVQNLPGGVTQLFTRHKGSNLECHGTIDKRLLFQPASIDSSTHRMLTKHIAKNLPNYSKGRKIQMTATTEAPEARKLKEEKTWEEKRRLQQRQASRHRASDEYAPAPTLSADFLEADDEAGDLGAIKRRFKDERSRARAGGPGGSGGRKRSRLYRDTDEADADEEDEDGEMDEREWDAEERRAAASGEMDDFIAAEDDEEEESAEESDEFGAMDDDDDDEALPPRKKR